MGNNTLSPVRNLTLFTGDTFHGDQQKNEKILAKKANLNFFQAKEVRKLFKKAP